MASGPLGRLLWDVRAFCLLAAMWIRVSWSYRTSFVLLLVGSLVITGIDFASILVLFGTVDRLGGFDLPQIAFLYGATTIGLGIADLIVGNVERLGQRIRLGTFDALMVRPVSILVSMCADGFALRRLGRVIQGVTVFAWSLTAVGVAWSPARVLVTFSMLLSAALVFTGLFVLGAAFQFVSTDGSEVANAFTYGGNALTQYPLTIYPREAVMVLTFLVPLAFVNWYPALFVLGRPDPLGLPGLLRFASPVAALVVCGLATLAWRTGVRHYRSTGS